jgi:type III secretory pathway component EscU
MKNIFQEKADHFMYAGCLLLTKGMLINKNCINSLLNKNNIFSIENFNEFVESNIG